MSGIHWNTADYLQILTPNDLRFIDGRIKTHGSGSPEGVLTAVLGSEYTDTATGSLYLKTSGSGNTGWSLIAVGSSTSVLPGTIIAHVSSSQSGYLLCDGSPVSRSTYSSLFAVMPNASSAVTMTIASPCVVTWTSHGLTTGSQIQFSTTGALPTGITAGDRYFVRVLSGSTFNLYSSFAAAMDLGSVSGIINTSGSQSGIHTATTYFYGNGDGSTTFNVPNLEGLVPRGIGTTTGFPINNPTVGIGEFTNDQMQAWQVGVSEDTTGAKNYYGRGGIRDLSFSTTPASGFTTLSLEDSAQGDVKMAKPMNDGTHGTPRTGFETRGKSLGVYFLIKT